MDARRIEEFRRKLREGKQVRVLDGKVVLDGTTGASPQTPPGGQAPRQAPEGVQVKPHEWGAPEAQEPFFLRPRGEARALQEQALLAREYPGFEMDVDDDGTPFAHGYIGPTETLRDRYHVLIVIPPGYGHGVPPSAYVLEPPIAKGAPHLFKDGSLCMDHSGAFTHKSTIVTLLAWVSVWLVLYEGWVETGAPW